jgi:D-alanyl-D-alanine carboxypeptidase (penicillin-binding protein 5/6)
MNRIFPLLLTCLLIISQAAWAARTKLDTIAGEPYMSALVIDADTGKILFDDNSEAVVYPASVLKLMSLLIILEHIERGTLRLDDMVQVTKEAAQMGGSQVYLDPKEQFSVEDLLYALTVQSANDAAVALATRVAGSKAGFVSLMNARAEELGMKNSHFYSVHGLPPSDGQKPDETTARDLSLLARELANKPDVFKYTSTRERNFRDGKFIMRTHNHLLAKVDGCDGFKTGYFKAAGFSIVATAKKRGVRIIAIVMGSKDRKVRDIKATELLAKGFALVPPKPVNEKISTGSKTIPEKKVQSTSSESQEVQPLEEKAEPAVSSGGGWGMFFWGLGAGLLLFSLLAVFFLRKRPKRYLRNY